MSPTPRQLAREETLARIKTLAVAQLASTAASELSLRGIARELGLVPSAIYRYYAGRDDLVTALILDAYGDLAAAISMATRTHRTPRQRWVDGALALRVWAVTEPHRFALIYGSVIPGYQAPPSTVAPAAAVAAAVIEPLATGPSKSGADPSSAPAADPSSAAATDPADLRVIAEQLSRDVGLAVPADRMLRAVSAFAQLIGMLTLELGGHFVGSFDPADGFYAHAVDRLAADLV